MAFLARVKNWIPGEILYASDLNTEFNNIVNVVLVDPGSDAEGDLYFFNGTVWTRFPAGTVSKFLRTLGSSSNPKWDTFIQSDFAAVLHSWLQGLSYDNHPQYLNLNKANQIILQNILVAAGITIDGRDISVDGSTLDGLPSFPVGTANIAANAVTRGAEFYTANPTTLGDQTETQVGSITVVTNLTSDMVWLWGSAVIILGGITGGGPVEVLFRIRRGNISGTEVGRGGGLGLDFTPIIPMGVDTPGGSAGNQTYLLTAQCQQNPYYQYAVVAYLQLMGLVWSK